MLAETAAAETANAATSSTAERQSTTTIPLLEVSGGCAIVKTSKSRNARKRKRRDGYSKPSSLWQTPWIQQLGMTEYESKEQRLHDEIVACVSYCDLTKEEVQARKLVTAKVEELIKRRFSSCEVMIFGSMAVDLCLPDSDIDLVILTAQVHDENYKTRALFQLASLIQKALLSRNSAVATGARVPILKFCTEPTLGALKFDISINADDGMKIDSTIKTYLSEMPALRYLTFVLKMFLAKQQLHDGSKGGLTSYGLLCLLICYLKVNPRKRPREHFINFMENESLGVLLKDFFDFYGKEFDWVTSCASPARGEIITKQSIGYSSDQRPDALSIDCLVTPGRDIGRVITKSTEVRKAFQAASDALEGYQLSMTNYNILGSIIGIYEKVSDHRQLIQHLVGSNELEANLNALQLPAAWTPPNSRNSQGKIQYHGMPPQQRVGSRAKHHISYPAAATSHPSLNYMTPYFGPVSASFGQPLAAYPMNMHPLPTLYFTNDALSKRQRVQY